MSSDSTSALEAFNKALVKANPPSAEVNDFVFSFWHKSNWGELLQAAPMALLVLSNLSVVAVAADFKLVAPKGGFEYVKYPDDFRATIVQLVDNGLVALEKSYVDFDEIQKRCAAVKPAVNAIIELLAGIGAESEHEQNDNIRRFLPNQVAQLQAVIQTCLAKAKETDKLFQDLLYLTMEIHESCSATQGQTNAKLSDAAMRQAILQATKSAVEEHKELAQKQEENARAAFNDARKHFDSAVQKMPSGLGLVAIELAKGVSNTIVSGLTAGLNMYLGRAQQTLDTQYQAINAAGGVTTSSGPPLIPDSCADRAYQKGSFIYKSVQALEALATGGEKGGVDWDHVSATNESGAAWLRISMQATLDSLKLGSGEPAKEAEELLKQAIKLAQGLQDAAPTRNEEAIEKLVLSIKLLVAEAATFAATAANKSGAIPMQSSGFAKPSQAPNNVSGSAARMALSDSQMMLETTQQTLQASSKITDEATARLVAVTAQLGEVMGQISALDTQKIDWEKLRAILLRAISFLCQLKGCLANLVHFFDSINNLVGVTLNESVAQFIQLITDATKDEGNTVDKSVAGISFSNWTRQAIYNQALGAAKVARLVQNIAEIYLKMYEGHVQAGVQKVLSIGQYMDTPDSEHTELRNAVKDIEGWARQSSAGIEELIKTEQAKMRGDIEGRMAQLQKDLGGILPPPAAAVKRAIADATQAHITEVSSALATAAANKPGFQPMLGMTL